MSDRQLRVFQGVKVESVMGVSNRSGSEELKVKHVVVAVFILFSVICESGQHGDLPLFHSVLLLWNINLRQD